MGPAGVIDVTGLLWITPSFFGQRVIPLSIQKMTMGLDPCGSHNRLTLAKDCKDFLASTAAS
jgi:hypothetical protein